MSLEHYGLREPPFSNAPDLRFVHLDERRRAVLSHLRKSLALGQGPVLLTGEAGSGKSTLVRALLEAPPEDTRLVLLDNPRQNAEELVQSLCEALGVEAAGGGGGKARFDALVGALQATAAIGGHIGVVVDEAQDLPDDALEQLRLLDNLDDGGPRLLRILLVGQPELRDRIASPALGRLAQRVSARYSLEAMTEDETDAYLRHRLRTAGAEGFPFSKLGVRRLHRDTGGLPRLVDRVAERAMRDAAAAGEGQIGERRIADAARLALTHPIQRMRLPRLTWLVGGGLFAAILAFWLLSRPAELPTEPRAADGAIASAPHLDPDALAERLLASEPVASELTAWTRLLALWQMRAEEVDINEAMQCAGTVTPGIHCLRGRANLTKLAAIGRPALLRLRLDGRDSWVVLLGLDAVRARIALNGETVDVDRTQVERLWNGEYIAVWRAPEFISLPLRRGGSGPTADWLRDRLPTPGDPVVVGPQAYDEELEAEVRRMQLRRGLVPDGIVGLETLLALTAEDGSGPELRRNLR